jgi:Helix-turn-helix domain
MDERLKFVARRLAGEPMADLCREFGISRKTGYKIFDRYQECGVEGLTDRSRRPYRYAQSFPFRLRTTFHMRKDPSVNRGTPSSAELSSIRWYAGERMRYRTRRSLQQGPSKLTLRYRRSRVWRRLESSLWVAVSRA